MIRRVFFCAILFLLTAAAAFAQNATNAAQDPVANDSWKIMYQRNIDEIRYQLTSKDGISHLRGMITDARQDLTSLRDKLDELIVMARVSESNPMELRAVLGGLNILGTQLNTIAEPFRKAQLTLKNAQERLESLGKEFANEQPTDSSPPTSAAPQADAVAQRGGKSLSDFLADIGKLKERLGRGQALIEQVLGPARDMQATIDQTAKTVTEKIPLAWHNYYLTPGNMIFSLRGWTAGIAQVADLPNRVSTMGSFLGGDQGKTLELFERMFGLLAILIALWAIILKKAGARVPWLNSRRLLRALSWVSAGAAVLWATSGTAFVLINAQASALAEILLARGLLGLAWYLRGLRGKAVGARTKDPEPQAGITAGDAAAVPSPADGPLTAEASAQDELASAAAPVSVRKPGSRAWWMFVAATILDLPWLPDVTRAAPWILLLLLAGWVSRNSKIPPGKDLTARLSVSGGWLYPILCVPTIFGWVNLTLLIAKGWFLLLVFLQIGIALNDLGKRLLSRPAQSLTSNVLMDLARGIATPLSAVLSAGGFLFWLSISLGGQSVFRAIISTNLTNRGVTLDLLRLTEIFTGFYLARAATRVADRLIATLPGKRPDLEHGILNLLETLSAYVIWGIFALSAMELAGASLTSLAVVAGGLSVGIGFGLQHIINNFISGLILLFGRSVQAGDVLQIGDIWGTVQRVNIRNTVVQTFDNATLFVPNSDLITQKLMNWSHKDRRVRRAVDIGVAYGADVEQVRSLLLRAASSRPHVLATPKPAVQLISFGDIAVRFKLLFWVDDLDNAARVVSEVHMAVEKLFQEQGVAIPTIPHSLELKEKG